MNPSNDTDATFIKPELAPESVVILSVICALASICGSLGNSLVMLAVYKSENLRSIPDFFISSLAFSDFTVCFIYFPFSIYYFNHFTSQVTQQNSSFDIAKSFFGYCSLSASLTNMFAVTVDRVIAIRFPFKYPAIMTVKTAMTAIALVWLISLTFGAIYTWEIPRFVIVPYGVLLMLSTMGMYAYIFFIAKRQENKVHTLNSSTQPHTSAEQQQAEKKAAKTIFTVVGIYALCWFPLLLFPAIINPSKKPVLFKTILPWIQTVLSCNSALNPYVYCVRSPKYRRQFAKLLRIN